MRPKMFRQQLDALKHRVATRLAHLVETPDPGTLRELRVSLRRLRSLLRPLSGRKGFAPLHRLAGQVLKATGPLRDLEVLTEELACHHRAGLAALRQERLQQGLLALTGAPVLDQLERCCRPFPADAPAIALPDRDALEKRCRKTLERNRQRLREHLDASRIDLHVLRLDIKRLRYLLLVQQVPAAKAELQHLTAAQTLLGEWHDREVWLEQAETESDLRPCRRRWQQERDTLALQMPALLGQLRTLLDQQRDR